MRNTVLRMMAASLAVIVLIGVADRGHAANIISGWHPGNTNFVHQIPKTVGISDSFDWAHTGMTSLFAFEDYVGFTLNGPAVIAGAVKLTLSIAEIENFIFSLINGTAVPPALGAIEQSVIIGANENQADLILSGLDPGEYVFGVSGTITGSGNAGYHASVGVVPVPAALPLLLTALAGLTLIGRRRMKAAA